MIPLKNCIPGKLVFQVLRGQRGREVLWFLKCERSFAKTLKPKTYSHDDWGFGPVATFSFRIDTELLQVITSASPLIVITGLGPIRMHRPVFGFVVFYQTATIAASLPFTIETPE